MVSRHVFMVVAFYVFVCASRDFLNAGSGLPIGILTRAYDAQLNSSQAYARLSVFEGEALSMGKEGKLGVRVGVTNLAFSQGAQATLQRITEGTHVDMLGGTVFFAAPEGAMVEIHIADAFLRVEGNRATQAEVKMMEPKVPQVSAMHGNLELTYRSEFQLIPEGETYRIYLDGPAEPQKPSGGTTVATQGISHKVVIYIVAGAMATGGAARGVHDLLQSMNGPESPAKP